MIFFFILFFVNFSFLNAEECGNSLAASGLVVKGEKVVRGEFPFLIALFKRVDDRFFCGSNLISKRHALTGL